MPVVPYTGTQSVAPQDTPVPRDTVQATPEAFGVNVWQATRQLGATADQVGNEIFARGVAMQDLYNHSEAQQAAADYMKTSGQIYAKLDSMQGKDAVDYYTNPDGFSKDLDNARQSIRDGLSNPMSQKLFDSESLSTVGRLNMYGARHSAEQNKAYAIGSSKARVAAVSDQTLAAPQDEDAFQKGLQDVETETRAQGQIAGWGDDQTNEAIAQEKSALWSKRIIGLAKSQPILASQMLKQATADGQIRGEDIGKLTNLTQQANHTVGARMISHEVNTGAGNRFGQGQVDIGQAANAIGTYETGNNYGAIGVQTSHGRALGRYQVMEQNLPEFLAKAGLPSMTADEFLKNHTAQDQVFNSVFGGYMKQTGSFNDAASMWFSGKPQAQAGGAKDALGTTVPAYVTATNAILAKNAPLATKVAMGQSMAAERVPDDPLFPDYVRDRMEADAGKTRMVQRDDQFQNRQVIETALLGGQDGKLPTTVEELNADPKTEQAWDYLVANDPAGARRYMAVLTRNSKGDVVATPDTVRQTQRLKGMAHDDPADFLDMDVASMALPLSDRRMLSNLQLQVKQNSQADPRVTRALGVLAPDLQAAGITRANKDDYYQFTGALADQLQQFAEDNKRPPKIDEIKTIGARLLQSHTSPGTFGMLFGGVKNPTFQVPVPDEEATKIKADPQWTKLGITPTDQQIRRIYTRKLYQNFYGGTAKVEAQNQPAAPRSE